MTNDVLTNDDGWWIVEYDEDGSTSLEKNGKAYKVKKVIKSSILNDQKNIDNLVGAYSKFCGNSPMLAGIFAFLTYAGVASVAGLGICKALQGGESVKQSDVTEDNDNIQKI